jgi:hypothetical protein
VFELAIGSGLARPRTLRCGNGDIEEERRRGGGAEGTNPS